jgi:hypothetical protein
MPSKSKDANPARRCGKAWKKKPGIASTAHAGRTVDGYTPAKLALRAEKRAAKTTVSA